jgi:hypothetical protein
LGSVFPGGGKMGWNRKRNYRESETRYRFLPPMRDSVPASSLRMLLWCL